LNWFIKSVVFYNRPVQFQLKRQRGEMLTHLVMQFARDAAAFVFLRSDDAIKKFAARRFRDAAAARGITAELVPGILPVSNFTQLKKMAAGCNTTVPAWMGRLFEGLDDKPAARQLVAATVAAELCRRLYAGGVRHFHFYTLNRAELSYAICHMLGVRPAVAAQELAA